jgi:hypothetical protein
MIQSFAKMDHEELVVLVRDRDRRGVDPPGRRPLGHGRDERLGVAAGEPDELMTPGTSYAQALFPGGGWPHAADPHEQVDGRLSFVPRHAAEAVQTGCGAHDFDPLNPKMKSLSIIGAFRPEIKDRFA